MTKMKRIIKKHLLPFLFWSYVWFVIVGLYVVINDMAAVQHGYRCWGIEDIIFVALVLYATVKPLIKKIARCLTEGARDERQGQCKDK